MSRAVDVCVVVPAGRFDLAGLVAALGEQRPGLGIGAVWSGDVHGRPPLPDGVRWVDLDLPEPSGVGWGRLLAALPPRAYEWARTGRAVARILRGGGSSVLVVRAGSAVVTGPIDEWWPSTGVALIERASRPLPLDGLAPSGSDLVRRGRWSDAVIGVAADAVDVIDELATLATVAEPADETERLVGAAVEGSTVHVSTPASGLVIGWRIPEGRIGVLDVDDLDPVEPWRVGFEGRRPRVLFSRYAGLAAAVDAARPQIGGEATPVALPGGVVVDASIRTLMSASINEWRRGDGELPPDPFGSGAMLEWLQSPTARSGGAIGRYWFEEWARRPDLHAAFPDPMGDDRERFLRWAEQSWQSDGRSAMIRATVSRPGDEWRDVGRAPGVNVIGYIASDSGLGDFTRRLHRSLEEAGVSVSGLHYGRTASPVAGDVPALTTDVGHDVNLITVHGDQMRFFADDHGAAVFPGRRSIGYWFWELSELTPRVIQSIDMVDEVWAATEFVADAYRRVTDKPVRVVPVPVPEPERSSATRSDLGLPADRFVFLVTFDHLSITDRKNPIGAIRAFERAFPQPSDDGPMLFVKTLNADERWSEHEELQLAASSRPDVVVVDRHLSRADQMRLIELSDCLVSLHRSEGLGLHLMEAMWLGVPVIATRYSGNLDFMDEYNSVLIDAELVPVVDRQGYYPASAVWAEPDAAQAASAMRRVVDDDADRARIGSAARHDMMQQPSMTHTGHLIARLCREAVPTSEE